MSTIPDLRHNPSHSQAKMRLKIQWPSDPFRPSAPRAQVSGIDCLAVLYRFIHAPLPRGHWPPTEPEGAANQAILRYFWADFGHMDRDDGPGRDQLRQAALAQMQSTMRGANVDFEALCESPAMMEAMWARDGFRFYRTPWSRFKGDDIWKERPEMYSPTDLASFGRIEWDPKSHPMLQELVDQIRECVVETRTGEGKMAEFKCIINEPLVVQVKLVVSQGVRVSLDDAHRFTAVTMRPGDNAPPVAGTTKVYAYDTAKSWGYVLTAVVQTRNAASGIDYDTIRLFYTDGRECLPKNTVGKIGGQAWRGNTKAALPEGQTFLLVYRRVSEFESNGLFGAALEVENRVLSALVDRKLAEDEDFFRAASDDEKQRSNAGPGPARADISSSVPKGGVRPQGQLFSAGLGGFGSPQQAVQHPAGWQAAGQGAAGPPAEEE